MLRSILAVIGGFVAMSILVMAGTFALMAALMPGGLQTMRGMRDAGAASVAMPTPTPRYFVLNIALSFVAALLGGWVTARIASHAPMAHLLALCALIAIMGVASAFTPGSAQQPVW
ncbi:MAG: hypothetical protein JWM41_4155 [Gemmatimonadetes bacterium]|nr:hypothetical protein [Gemmatimonadota bacterium]